MLNLNYLKRLLFDDVKNIGQIEENIENTQGKIVLYKDLIDFFNKKDIDILIENLSSINILLEKIYDKDFVKSLNLEKLFYDYKCASLENKKRIYDKVVKLIDKINSDYLFLKDKLNYLKSSFDLETLKNSRKVITCLKYKQYISHNLSNFIKERLIKEGINDKEIIYIFELINIHNSKIDTHKALNYTELYYILIY